MAYSFKRVRELIPKHLEDKYRANSDDPKEWFWDIDYDGDLFEAAADYILELKAALEVAKAEVPNNV